MEDITIIQFALCCLLALLVWLTKEKISILEKDLDIYKKDTDALMIACFAQAIKSAIEEDLFEDAQLFKNAIKKIEKRIANAK